MKPELAPSNFDSWVFEEDVFETVNSVTYGPIPEEIQRARTPQSYSSPCVICKTDIDIGGTPLVCKGRLKTIKLACHK